MDVFLLWHSHETAEGAEDDKFIGVYATPDDAEAARSRLADQPGFRDHPDGFVVSREVVGRDNWSEGFISWEEAPSPPTEDHPSAVDVAPTAPGTGPG